MAVVAGICFVVFVFVKGKAEEEIDRHELRKTRAVVTRAFTKPSKQEDALPDHWTEVKLPNGELWEVEGKLGVFGDVVEVEVPQYVLTEGKEGRDESKLGKE